ncbi:hypothetical protein P5V15_008793 [Pogonomyrmex californicus]
MMTDANDSIISYKRRYRINLRNAELSKHTFRIFLEKQILSHVQTEIQKNIQELQTPLTPNFDFDESNLILSKIQFTLSPFQTAISKEKLFIKNDLNLPNLEAKICPSDKAMKIINTIVNHDINSEIDIYEDSVRNESKVSTYTAPISNQNNHSHPKNKVIDKKHSYALIHDNSPDWFQDNEIISVHGSLLSETISDINMYNSNLKRNTNRKRCRWRRILFCCVN